MSILFMFDGWSSSVLLYLSTSHVPQKDVYIGEVYRHIFAACDSNMKRDGTKGLFSGIM